MTASHFFCVIFFSSLPSSFLFFLYKCFPRGIALMFARRIRPRHGRVCTQQRCYTHTLDKFSFLFYRPHRSRSPILVNPQSWRIIFISTLIVCATPAHGIGTTIYRECNIKIPIHSSTTVCNTHIEPTSQPQSLI